MNQSQCTSTVYHFLDSFSKEESSIENFSPNLSSSFLNQAQIFFDLGRLDEALVQVSEALKLNAQFCEAYYLKGEIHRRKGQKQSALESYQMCVKLKTKEFFIYYNIGLLLFEFDKKEDALKYFDISLSFKVTYEALTNKSILLLEFNMFTECLEICDQAIELSPNIHTAYFIKEAIFQYDQALKHNPLLVNAINNKAVAQMKLGHKDKALETLKQARKISPDDIVNFNLFKLFRFQGNLEKSNSFKLELQSSQNKKIKQEIQNIHKIEQAIEDAKLELQFINLRDQSFHKKLLDYENQLKAEYALLWNYDIEFDQKVEQVSAEPIEQINQLIQDSLQSEECLIRQQLSVLQNRIYFQSFYWRLINYLKICQRITSEISINQETIKMHIDNLNSQNQPLLPMQQDQLLYGKRERFTKNQFTKSINNHSMRTKLPQINSLNNSPQQSMFVQNKKNIKKITASSPFFQKTLYAQTSRNISSFDENFFQKEKEYVEYQPIQFNEDLIKAINKALQIHSYKSQQLGNIIKVISNKVKIESQLELEIQFAICNLAKGGRIQSKQSHLKEVIQEIQNIENSLNQLPYIKSQEWITGIQDTIQVLSYLKDQSKTLLEPQSPPLRIIIQGGQSYSEKSNNQIVNSKQDAQRTSQSCFCQIF